MLVIDDEYEIKPRNTAEKVEYIKKNAPEMIDKIREGRTTIDRAYSKALNKAIAPVNPVTKAKREHKEFQKKKEESVVDFQDIEKDRENQKILAYDFYSAYCSALNGIDKLVLLRRKGELPDLISMLSDEMKADLIRRTWDCITILKMVDEDTRGEVERMMS